MVETRGRVENRELGRLPAPTIFQSPSGEELGFQGVKSWRFDSEDDAATSDRSVFLFSFLPCFVSGLVWHGCHGEGGEAL